MVITIRTLCFSVLAANFCLMIPAFAVAQTASSFEPKMNQQPKQKTKTASNRKKESNNSKGSEPVVIHPKPFAYAIPKTEPELTIPYGCNAQHGTEPPSLFFLSLFLLGLCRMIAKEKKQRDYE